MQAKSVRRCIAVHIVLLLFYLFYLLHFLLRAYLYFLLLFYIFLQKSKQSFISPVEECFIYFYHVAKDIFDGHFFEGEAIVNAKLME